jgi:ankyrin repeat protein
VSVLLALKRSVAVPPDAFTTRHKGASLLHLAAATGHTTTVVWLLERRELNVNDVTDGDGFSVLHCAVLGGSAEVVKKVVAAGANAKQQCVPLLSSMIVSALSLGLCEFVLDMMRS